MLKLPRKLHSKRWPSSSNFARNTSIYSCTFNKEKISVGEYFHSMKTLPKVLRDLELLMNTSVLNTTGILPAIFLTNSNPPCCSAMFTLLAKPADQPRQRMRAQKSAEHWWGFWWHWWHKSLQPPCNPILRFSALRVPLVLLRLIVFHFAASFYTAWIWGNFNGI